MFTKIDYLLLKCNINFNSNLYRENLMSFIRIKKKDRLGILYVLYVIYGS